MTTDLISARDAAELLGVSVPTVTRLALDGILPTATKAPGLRGARMFRRRDVLRLVAKRAKEQAA